VPKQGTLPTAATCFNMLKLPLFPDFDVLQEKLAVAIENNTGFGLA
jgi:E3 ubiquitin-protein ligase NEDD4